MSPRPDSAAQTQPRFVHVWWEGYRLSATSQQPVDDIRYVTLGITALGVIVGALSGAIAGAAP